MLSSGIVQHGLSAHTADILDSNVERGGSFLLSSNHIGSHQLYDIYKTESIPNS